MACHSPCAILLIFTVFISNFASAANALHTCWKWCGVPHFAYTGHWRLIHITIMWISRYSSLYCYYFMSTSALSPQRHTQYKINSLATVRRRENNSNSFTVAVHYTRKCKQKKNKNRSQFALFHHSISRTIFSKCKLRIEWAVTYGQLQIACYCLFLHCNFVYAPQSNGYRTGARCTFCLFRFRCRSIEMG